MDREPFFPYRGETENASENSWEQGDALGDFLNQAFQVSRSIRRNRAA